jgi:redox-sensitive bicupin YhaK (pirin superfamily)
MGGITPPAVPGGAATPILSGMNTATTIDRPLPQGHPISRVRSVEGIHRSTGFHWVGDGFFVSTYFPSSRLSSERVSPFVLMDYGPAKEFSPLARGKRGVGWHPHRGFETVTLAWEGSVAHRDNAGHADVIGPGDAQWMTAASGIFHEEYHEEEITRRGGRLHMMQLWVNLPRKDKMAKPGYQALKASQIPNVTLPGGGTVRVIAGEYEGARGPAHTFTPITMLDIHLRAGEELPVALPATYNALAVVAKGRVTAGSATASAGELLLFANDGERLLLSAAEDAHIMLLAGEPINEPIVQHGPFVMNSVAEIKQAILDVERGKFGPIPE